MDFFAAEERAKKRTRYLIFLFALGLAGTILAAYFFARLGEGFLANSSNHRYRYADNGYAEAQMPIPPCGSPG